jgi:hypothetical protein
MITTKFLIEQIKNLETEPDRLLSNNAKEIRIRMTDLYNVVCKMGFEPDLLIEQLRATNSL